MSTTLCMLTPGAREDLTGVVRTQVVSNAAPRVHLKGGIVDVHLVDNPALQVHLRRGGVDEFLCVNSGGPDRWSYAHKSSVTPPLGST